MHIDTRTRVVGGLAVLATCATVAALAFPATAAPQADRSSETTTPIKHVVVLYDENVSFDHYFGTYPKAANTDGTSFTAASGTPTPNNYVTHPELTTQNPNKYQPARLTHEQALTCDQNHAYTPEQKAVNNGAMDKFVESVSKDTCTGLYGAPGLTMDYYDGNTVTAQWNYAQHFAMSDNSWDTTFGPSTPGAMNLISGQTGGAQSYDPKTNQVTSTPDAYAIASPNSAGVGTVINDPDPVWDDCSDKNHTSTNKLAGLQGANVGDLLNKRGVTWGWFQGGFKPTTAWDGTDGHYAVCGASHANIGGANQVDYSPHHSPFQYYRSTSNPHHLPPTSVASIGHTDQANHNYDLTDLDAAIDANNLPAVSYVKAGEYQDGHPGYSDPIDEQNFLVNYINKIQKSPAWSSTAIVIAYDDSDGWYDHVAPKVVNGSNDAATDQVICTSKSGSMLGGIPDRCGPSQRLPMIVISPYAKQNYIDHTEVNQVSILRFVEENWSTGKIDSIASPNAVSSTPSGTGTSTPSVSSTPTSTPTQSSAAMGSFDSSAAFASVKRPMDAPSTGSSFDTTAGSINGMFDFGTPNDRQVILNADGSVQAIVTPTPTPSTTGSATPTTPATASATPTTAPTASASNGPVATRPAASPTASRNTAGSGSLPYTGAQIALPLGIAAVLLIAGTVVLIVRQRRRESHSQQ